MDELEQQSIIGILRGAADRIGTDFEVTLRLTKGNIYALLSLVIENQSQKVGRLDEDVGQEPLGQIDVSRRKTVERRHAKHRKNHRKKLVKERKLWR